MRYCIVDAPAAVRDVSRDTVTHGFVTAVREREEQQNARTLHALTSATRHTGSRPPVLRMR